MAVTFLNQFALGQQSVDDLLLINRAHSLVVSIAEVQDLLPYPPVLVHLGSALLGRIVQKTLYQDKVRLQ